MIFGIIDYIYTYRGIGYTMSMHNLQHVTMYLGFSIWSMVELLTSNGKCRATPGVAKASLGFAFFTTISLFVFHLHGKSPVDGHLHVLQVVISVLVIISMVFESIFVNSPLVALFRPMLTTVMGTWFIQIGYIIWGPFDNGHGWSGDDHHLIMMSTVVFVWHLWSGFVIFIIIIPSFVKRSKDKLFNYIDFQPLTNSSIS